MPRRIPDYPDAFAAWNAINSFGSLVSVVATALFGYILYDILVNGKPVNPHQHSSNQHRHTATSLEWGVTNTIP